MQVYKITNLVNGKYYIGKDKHSIKNYLGSGKIIKSAILKYGIENFKKEILQECNDYNILSILEIFWIKELNASFPNNGGDALSKHPNKLIIIEKTRAKNKGKKRTKEFCEKMKTNGKKRNASPLLR
jgi:hypothetical protein